MADSTLAERERFRSRLGFILISAGCAIGLGNIWRFPYIVGEYGGAAFVVMYLVFHLCKVPKWPGFNKLFDDFVVEALYVFACALIWQIISLLLHKSAVHNKLIPLYRKIFAHRGENGDKVLPFPYFIDQAGVVRSRVGKTFYRKMIQGIILGVALVYLVYFLLMELTGIKFYLLSSFALFGLLPLTDCYH